MANWLLIVLVVFAAVGILLLMRRNRATGGGPVDPHQLPPLHADYVKDREASRLANMSAEDRAWETSTLQRNRANQERQATSGQ